MGVLKIKIHAGQIGCLETIWADETGEVSSLSAVVAKA